MEPIHKTEREREPQNTKGRDLFSNMDTSEVIPERLNDIDDEQDEEEGRESEE